MRNDTSFPDKSGRDRNPKLARSRPPSLIPTMATAAAAAAAASLLLSSATSNSRSRSPLLLSPPERLAVAPSPAPQSGSLIIGKRGFLTGFALSSVMWKWPAEAREVEVGAYLPASSSNPSFVLFKATPKDTPALRAGNVEPYEFILPPTWKQTRIANILSGNYCQPKCAEPWIEVKFENEKQGKIQVVASPLIRLTNKPNATIEDIGSPEKVIASLGPFVTGNTFDPDELVETSIEKHGDQTYYTYVLETPFALTGSHNLAKATAKGSTVILFVASANDRQWPSSEKTLKAMLDSFQIQL